MTLADSFIKYMESIGVGTFGQSIWYGEAPSSQEAQDNLWWVVETGGRKLTKLMSGESIKEYTLNLYYRDRDPESVKNAMFDLEEKISCSDCVQLQGFQTVEIEVVAFPIDQDLDSEDRKVGLLQVNIRTYKSC